MYGTLKYSIFFFFLKNPKTRVTFGAKNVKTLKKTLTLGEKLKKMKKNEKKNWKKKLKYKKYKKWKKMKKNEKKWKK